MAYLGLGLIAEGPSDHSFLGPLLQRTVQDVCLRDAMSPVEVSDVMNLPVACPDGCDYFQAAAKVASQAAASCNLIFLHRDSGGRAQQADMSIIDRLFQQVSAAVPASTAIRVVPVQEMEAWALADGDALRSAFKAKLSDATLGVPAKPAHVERVTDPKNALEQVYRRTVSGKRRRRSSVSFLEVIALSVGIDRLRMVPAFNTFEQELIATLAEKGYLRPRS